MIMDLPSRWLISILFAVAVGGSIYRMWIDRSLTSEVSHAFHITASLSMLMMIWPEAPSFSSTLQVVLFAAGSVWFAVRAARSWRMRETRERFDSAELPIVGLYHSYAMFVMLWMALVMTDRTAEGMAYHNYSLGSASGSSDATDLGTTANMHHRNLLTWPFNQSPSGDSLAYVFSAVFGAIFVVAALAWMFRPTSSGATTTPGVAASSNRRTLGSLKSISTLTSVSAGESGMAVGMAIMVLPMA